MPLPITLDVGQITSISPTVGTDQLHAGLLAGAIGLALVALYLLLYYRALGLVAVASLVIAALITYDLLVILGRPVGFTLTLAGVAGAIVAIGITADSFIVYFERIRDEVRDGSRCAWPPRPAGCGPGAPCWLPTSSRCWPRSCCTC